MQIINLQTVQRWKNCCGRSSTTTLPAEQHNQHEQQQHDHDPDPAHVHDPPHQCEVLAYMSDTDLNTGIFLFKATEETRQLMKTRYEWQFRHRWCIGHADQLALQEAMLEHYHFAVDVKTDNAAAAGVNNTDDADGEEQQQYYSLEDCHLAHETATSSYRKRRDCSINKLNSAREVSLARHHEGRRAPAAVAATEGYSPHHAPSTLPLGNNVCLFGGRSPTPLQCHYSHAQHDTCMKHHPLFNHVQKFPDAWS
jgi:hypothetical protein